MILKFELWQWNKRFLDLGEGLCGEYIVVQRQETPISLFHCSHATSRLIWAPDSLVVSRTIAAYGFGKVKMLFAVKRSCGAAHCLNLVPHHGLQTDLGCDHWNRPKVIRWTISQFGSWSSPLRQSWAGVVSVPPSPGRAGFNCLTIVKVFSAC